MVAKAPSSPSPPVERQLSQHSPLVVRGALAASERSELCNHVTPVQWVVQVHNPIRQVGCGVESQTTRASYWRTRSHLLAVKQHGRRYPNTSSTRPLSQQPIHIPPSLPLSIGRKHLLDGIRGGQERLQRVSGEVQWFQGRGCGARPEEACLWPCVINLRSRSGTCPVYGNCVE